MENLEKSCTYLDYRPASRCLRQVTWYEQLKFSCIMLCYKIFSVNFPYFTNYRLDNPQKPYSITTTSLKKMSIENMRKRRPIKTNKRKKRKAEEQLEQWKKNHTKFFQEENWNIFIRWYKKQENEWRNDQIFCKMLWNCAKFCQILQSSVKFDEILLNSMNIFSWGKLKRFLAMIQRNIEQEENEWRNDQKCGEDQQNWVS